MLSNMTLNDFLKELASDSPAPGGGSVSAVLGGLSSALCSMMANLTIGKKGYDDVQDESREIVDSMMENIQVFNDLIDEDASSFDGVMAAFQMPKSTDEEKAIRREAIQKGYKEAISVPLEIAETLLSISKDIEYIVKNGNKNVVTDGMAAAMCCKTGIRVALLNAKINIKSVKDEEYRSVVIGKIEYFETEAKKMEDRVLASVEL